MLKLADFTDYTDDEVVSHVELNYETNDVRNYEILIAYESVGAWGYDSSSWFLMRKDGKLYENHGSHCSYYGFEGQFEPEETTKESLLARCVMFYGGGYDDESDANETAARKFVENL